MKKYAMLLAIATLTVAVFALGDMVGKVDNTAHAQAGPPSNVSAANGANPGEAVVSWDAVAGASAYRVGWLAVSDYEANRANDQWRERFAYSDVNTSSSYTVTRLTPGEAYYFITGRKQDGDIAWSEWATLTLNSGALPCSTEPTVAPSTTSTLQIANGSNIGEVVVSWFHLPFYDGYRVGWLAVPDYQANIDNDRWRERFAYSDINPSSSYTVTRLTPGIAYYFILGRKNGDNIAWSQWASLALSADALACPFPASAVGSDYDHDNDGLIEVRTLAQLNAIRINLEGGSFLYTAGYLAAFPRALRGMGCPADGCTGYELADHLDFDTNGNGEADAGDAYWNDGAGWHPIGHYYDDGLLATFDGNGYTIANLYINRPGNNGVGLFGTSSGTIRNVELNAVQVTGNVGVGGLVGLDFGSISDSTASGTVTGNHDVGGLVGVNGDGAITNSAASGTVSGNDNVGGLVGENWGVISGSETSATVSGNVGVGGLVGQNRRASAISDSAASGDVSGNDKVGGLVGWNLGAYNIVGTISNSTAEGDATGRFYVGGLVGLNAGTIEDSTASGNVAGVRDHGPLVGANDGGTITNSTGTGTVSTRQ